MFRRKKKVEPLNVSLLPEKELDALIENYVMQIRKKSSNINYSCYYDSILGRNGYDRYSLQADIDSLACLNERLNELIAMKEGRND